jgi:uncharacterized membrane protein
MRPVCDHTSPGNNPKMSGDTRIKKTIWRPLVLGITSGTLAGLATATGLSILVPGAETDNTIGFWMALLLLAAALGGPIGGAVASVLLVTISTYFSPPEVKAIASDPVVYWTNLIVIALLMVLTAFAYRLIFQRVKMPARLLLWTGIVIAVYLINAPANIIPQFYFLDETGVLPAIVDVYKVYLPQEIFDIFFTSLFFVALPASFTRPLWYEQKSGLKIRVKAGRKE